MLSSTRAVVSFIAGAITLGACGQAPAEQTPSGEPATTTPAAMSGSSGPAAVGGNVDSVNTGASSTAGSRAISTPGGPRSAMAGSSAGMAADRDADAGPIGEPAAPGGSAGMAGAPVSGMSAPMPETDAGSTVAASVTASDPSALTRAWWAYERAPTFTVITEKVQVPTRDGITIGCTLSRPAKDGALAPGKFPGLVVEFTPYTLQQDTYNTEAAFFTTRGYNALVCNVRGTGESGGTWQHAFSRLDGSDAYDLVEWLAVQEYSDGRMGQLGESYGGQTTYGAAVEQAPHLRAIAPMQPPADLYDNVIFPGGIEALPDGAINNWPPIAELLSYGRISAQDEYASDKAHPTYDEYWQKRTLLGRHAAIQVPVLTIGGWQDSYFRSGTMMNIEGALERTWAIYGAWPHMPPVDLGTCDIACVEDPLPGGVILAWVDHWVMELKDVPIPEKPTFLSFENPKGASRGFRELSAWVPEGVDATVYELGADGSLALSAAATGAVSFSEPSAANAADGDAVFSSAPLDQDRVLLGHASLDVRAQLSAADAHFYVQLFDVDASDRETFVNDGFLKASHRNSHTTPEPVPVNEALDYHIAIRPQHHRFAAGHRVRIRIWSGPSQDLAQPAAVDVTLETGPSARLRLPGFAASSL